MMIVNESISFERGGNPRRSLNIGQGSINDIRHLSILKAKKNLKRVRNLELVTFDSAVHDQPTIFEGDYILITEPEYDTHTYGVYNGKPFIDFHFIDSRDSLKLSLRNRELYRDSRGPDYAFVNLPLDDKFEYVYTTSNESVNYFQRGLDPKEAMGIGRVVKVLSGSPGGQKNFLKVLIMDPTSEKNTVFNAKVLDDYMNGQKILVRKFDEPFGEFWGIEWRDDLGESLKFERGIDPKKSMNIGKSYLDNEIVKNTNWAIDVLKHQHIYDIVEVIPDYKGVPILVLRNKTSDSLPYRAISVLGLFTDYHHYPEETIKDIKRIIDQELSKAKLIWK